MFPPVERGDSTSAASWETLRDEALGEIDALIEDVTATHNDLRAYQAVLEKNRKHLARGGRVTETPALFDIRSVRTTLTERLNALERSRGAARLALWRLQLAEATTIAEIARVWGFSRQLVSRALAGRDARRDPR
jgi:AraC-like DNA-binding protein